MLLSPDENELAVKPTEISLQNLLAENCAEILRQGVSLLENIGDAEFSANGAFGGAIGGHFRHCLEFVDCFLAGIEGGKVDYDRRARNLRLETDRCSAIAGFRETVEQLQIFSVKDAAKTLFVRPEDSPAEADFWCESSIERELEFLTSHTIHHYALIAFKLRAMHREVPPEFGVAPSTLRFWTAQKSAA